MSNKKKIAVFLSGLDEEYQNQITQGIHEFAAAHNIDVLHFIAFGGILNNGSYDTGEYNIFRLPNLQELDGVILLTNTIASPETVREIINQVRASGVPAVSVDADYQDFFSICVDNHSAMAQIVRHFTDEHGLRRINYVSGPDDNPDSIARLTAYKQVLEEHNIPIEEARIYPGTFQRRDGRTAVDVFLRSDLPMPEAIVCANDTMAVSVIGALNAHGIRVPEDIMVSGFDNTYNARNYAPEISSVARPLGQCGALACQLLYNAWHGVPQTRVHKLEMQPRFTESCGCGAHYCDTIRDFKKHNYQIQEDFNVDISLLSRMACSLVECANYEEYIEALKEFVLETNCEEFYLCLCENWLGHALPATQAEPDPSTADACLIHGYTQRMLVPLSYYEGKFRCHEDFHVDQMLPALYRQVDHMRCFYFVPLHFREHCLGYYAICNTAFPMRSSLFHSWSLNLSNSMENIRRIIYLDHAVQELDKLYATDPLSGIANRNGFRRQTEPVFARCIAEKHPVMVMFIDMDGLKMINDTYGHKSGDIAIRSMATILHECCTNGEICCRFGGDEFIVFAANYTQQDAERITDNIQKKLEDYNRTTSMPFALHASSGYHIAVPTPDKSLFAMVTLADTIMYAEKRKKRHSKYLKSSSSIRQDAESN